MDNVNCTGKEASLDDCKFDGWGVSNCGHYKDASVLCQTGTYSRFHTAFVLFHKSLVNQVYISVYFNTLFQVLCGIRFGAPMEE